MTPDYLTAAEVAALYGVTRRQVTIWARAGKITGIHTPGGARARGPWRFPAAPCAERIRDAGGIPPRRQATS